MATYHMCTAAGLLRTLGLSRVFCVKAVFMMTVAQLKFFHSKPGIVSGLQGCTPKDFVIRK